MQEKLVVQLLTCFNIMETIPTNNKVIWSGPHWDASLSLAISPDVPEIIFFTIKYTQNFYFEGAVYIDITDSEESTMDMVMEKITKIYYHAVIHDYDQYVKFGGYLQ